jgi:hypothetical protein
MALKGNNNIKKIDLHHYEIIINDEIIKVAEAPHLLLTELNVHHTASEEQKIKLL